MAQNLAAGHGLHASSRVLGALLEAGLARPEAYGVVQRLALQAADAGSSFQALVEADPAITTTLSPGVLERCFDDRLALRHVDTVLARLETLDR
jgi:adenylosuccinate lyase